MLKRYEITNSRFYNSVKSKLNHAGLKGFVKKDYEEAAQAINLLSAAHPSQDEINAAVEWLKKKQNGKMIPVAGEPLANELPINDVSSEPLANELPINDVSSEPLANSNHQTLQITIAEAIAGAPDTLRNELLMDYAERRFRSAQDFLEFKNQIDERIDRFVATRIVSNNQQQEDVLDGVKTQLENSWELKRQQQQKSFQGFFDNLESRMAEFD